MPAKTAELEDLRQLLAINRIITSSLDYDEVLHTVVEKTAGFTEAEACLLLLADSAGEARVAASAGVDPDRARHFSAPLDEHIGATLRDFLGLGGGYAFTGVPVISYGGLRGILALYRREGRMADADEEYLLSALADQAAIALRHARAHRTLRRDLRISETLTERIFHHAPLGFLVLNTDLSIRELNATAARLLGWPRVESMGRPLAEVSAAAASALQTLCRSALAGASAGTAEIRCAHSGPAAMPESVLQVRCVALPDEAGQAEAVLAILSDITRETRSEQELFETNLRLQALMEALPVGVSFSEDAACRVITGNAAACAQFEAGPEANLSASAEDPGGLGRQVHYFNEGQRVAPGDLPLQRAVAENRTIPPMELEIELPGGRRWTSEVSAAPLRDRNGRATGGVAVTLDITERKRIEATLHRQAEQLREADRRKDEFLAMLGHELRNPLAPIQNAVHLLRRPELNPSQLGWCRAVIDRQVEQLSRLVDDLLDISRISRGKIELHKEPLRVADIVQRAVETSRPLIDARRHEFSVRLPPEPLHVHGDLVRLAQLLANLLNNAAKYTDEGGRIGLGVERDGGEALIRIRDTGRGVDPAVLPHLFELFYQADRTLDRAEGGLGIGLSLVKRLVDMHGGTVNAFSEGLGKGTEIAVRLPLCPETAAAGLPAAAVLPSGDRCRVLIVDDNIDAAESLAMLLDSDGYEVLTAQDGLHAVNLALSQRPDAVLLDIGLPELDGYEACRRMRAGGLRKTLIAAMTGYGQDEDRRKSAEAGFDAHLVKPAGLAEIREVLAGRRAGT